MTLFSDAVGLILIIVGFYPLMQFFLKKIVFANTHI